MKPLFKNVTNYNSKMYNEFVNFHDEKFGFSYNAYNVVTIMLLIYCIILNIINKEFTLLLIFIVMLTIFVLYRIYFPIKKYQKDQKKYSRKRISQFSYIFYQHYFKIEKKYYYYYKLHKIFETNDYFYLYLNEQEAFLVSKSGFQLGTSEEFSTFIKKKCLLKYHKNKEKKIPIKWDFYFILT